LQRFRQIRRLGWDPWLILRTVVHEVHRRVLDRVLRRAYEPLVVRPRGRARLREAPLRIGVVAGLADPLRAAAERIRQEADALLEHRVDLLGSGLVELGDEIDWQRDFKSGYRWPPAFYQDLEITRLTDSSDAKAPWELSRSHHLLTLARAFVLFEDERYARELEDQLRHWLDANPPGYGINWATPMEVAIRAINWIWAIRTLESVRPLDPALRARVAGSLEAHGRHIRLNLEGKPYVRSNHHLADLIGLLAIGHALEGEPAARRWFEFARTEMNREMEFQVLPDGVDFEASLPYHGLVLELFLIGHHLTRDAGAPLPPSFEQRLARMLEVSRAVRHPDGRTPQIGDADSGRILPAGSGRPPTQDPLLWLGAALVTRARPVPGEVDEEVAWTLGSSAWSALQNLPDAAEPVSTVFSSDGIYVLRAEGTHLAGRCGGVGARGHGSHAHNDLGSFELSFGELLVVADPGSYLYTADPDARNEFRSTAAHSTVRVAGEEIHPIDPAALFQLRQFANPWVGEVCEDDSGAHVAVSHDGYRRLSPPVVHRRTLRVARDGRRVSIDDVLDGRGRQQAESFVHLAPGVDVAGDDGGTELELRAGGRAVAVTFSGVERVEVQQGWVSDAYGSRVETQVLVATLAGELPLTFGCSFELRAAA
jgi:uncharacterized heparinase superfamily protein